MQADIKLTQWNTFGDHPLVTDKTCGEFEYQESKQEGCGFIDTWTIVRPGYYILEINGHFIQVLSPAKAREVFNIV